MARTIFDVGTDTDVQRSLGALLKAQASTSLEHIETGAMALESLLKVPDSELPQLVITPFRLPIMKGVDFVAEMRSQPRLREIPVLVWGAHITSEEINRLLAAGATEVIEGEFGSRHLHAVRQLCPQCFVAPLSDPASDKRRYTITSVLRDASEKAVRNARLGGLFVWTGCISAVLWILAFLQLGMSYTEADLAPLPVYAALTSAGFLLMLGRVGGRSLTR
jgi:CheY-like chemotaxis protein